jgi:hypothetical protein
MHRRRCRGRIGADGEQQRGRRDAVRHAEAAVHELRPETDEGEQDQFAHSPGFSTN